MRSDIAPVGVRISDESPREMFKSGVNDRRNILEGEGGSSMVGLEFDEVGEGVRVSAA